MHETEDKKVWNDSFAYRIRRKIIFNDLISKLPRSKHFLDIGLGGGNFCIDMARQNFSGEGIDISEEAVVIAKCRLKNYLDKVCIQKQDIIDKKNNKKYDIISIFEVLEHVKDDNAVVKKIYSLLDQDGYCVFSVPAHQKKWSILDEWAGHFRRYERKDIEKLLQDNNFSIKRIYSYGFPLVNFLRFIQKKLVKKSSVADGMEENTKKSGIDRKHGEKFKFLFNDFVVWPFYIIQKLFTNLDISTGYLVIAKKADNSDD